ncbi:DUF3310 domain-containing protein [Staphylococcus epidermidis]
MNIRDLSEGDIIRINGFNGLDGTTAKVKKVYFIARPTIGLNKWMADIETTDGFAWTINDSSVFYSLPDENEEPQKTLDDKVSHPTHYTYGDIEIIDFIEQVTRDYKPELAFAIGNAIKYISRANRKNGKEDLDKARWYLNRAFEKWED